MNLQLFFAIGTTIFFLPIQCIDQISPQEYTNLHQLACSANKSLNSLSKQDDLQDELKEYKQQDGCNRGPSGWMWKYFDEQEGNKANVLVLDHSIDERLANSIYTTATTRMANTDGFCFNAGDLKEDLLNMERVAGNQVDDIKCQHQLTQMITLMSNLREITNNRPNSIAVREQHIRLAQVLDSFGRYDSGHLIGRYISMGSYEQCQRSQLLLPKRGKNDKDDIELSSMRFCWARHRMDSLLDESLRARPKVNLEVEANLILSGICIPQSCHSKSFYKHKNLFEQIASSEFKLPRSMYANESLELESVFCLVDKTSEYAQVPLAGKFVISLLVAYTLFAIIVTCKQTNSNDAKLEEKSYLKALNLVESWKDFIQFEEMENNFKRVVPLQPLVDLDALSFFKVLGIVYVIWTHSAMFWIGLSMNTIYTFESIERNTAMLLTYASSTIVDSFFVISGILTSFLAMKQFDKFYYSQQQQENLNCGELMRVSWNKMQRSGIVENRFKLNALLWFFMSLKRYLRLVPMYLIWYWLKRSVFIYLAFGGPLWDYGLNKNSPIGSCIRDPWFVPLTPLSAYQPFANSCLPASWTISNEILFSLISPPLILLLYKRPKVVTFIVSIISSISLIWQHFAMSKLSAEILYGLDEFRGHSLTSIMTKYSHLYTRPEFRMYAIFIGTLGGYKLFKYEKRFQLEGSIESMKINNKLQKSNIFNNYYWPLNWLSIFLALTHYIVIIWSQDIKQLIVPHQAALFSYWLTWSRILWTLWCTFIFVRMMTDWKRSTFVRFCAAKFWKIQSKLCLCILLIHIDLMATIHFARTTTIQSSMLNAFVDTCGIFLISSVVSMILFILIENPLRKLFNMALQR